MNQTEKPIRKAVRCYLIKDDKIVAIKNKNDVVSNKNGFYDIPGGKIEEGETPKQAAIREMKEETGLIISNLKEKGKMIIEYPHKIFDFVIFTTNECEGTPQEFEENSSEWIEIDELLKKEKLLPNSFILSRFLIKGLIDDDASFEMYIRADDEENVTSVKYDLKEKNNT